MKTRVLLVDDHALTLIGMRCLLGAFDDLQIVGQAQDADGLLTQLDTHPCDLLITDLMMPDSQQADGLRLVQKVRRRYPQLQIIVVTMLNNPALISSLLKLGIRGLVSKRGVLNDLPKAIRHGGRRPFLSHSIGYLLDVGAAEHGKPLASLEELTPREVEVLRLYGSGLAIGEIALRLCRSKQTISAQKSSAMRKLGLDTNAGLYLYIQEHGLA
ncbi:MULTISPECIES: response regulator transcription factor [Pseudomonas aeruginosa group]|uniref:two-component system response regulator TtsR n=1 Tax=Pseudomonas aeruginosa group TaxID=136841 RepID=UPI0006B29232|nr:MULTISPECIES: response regulator transcription factor [Pseudomonas aeruginosa group]KPD30882.1 LuxR family transcriptional regulator [Pseudomonas paraeruginosa]KQB31021.1 LuxR family transcriptional regulator [Pseudomonas paraeruginosa]MDT1025358.1 response regulator transcription factor [Pseudomonas paraeruginosa]PHJ31386.1 DNA-binding response regulator [Pseudomonas paraeruginosa]QQV49933.1 response regulator transcription factor [Pseudomonas aeruginosa]